jgi:hypothetical protein
MAHKWTTTQEDTIAILAFFKDTYRTLKDT